MQRILQRPLLTLCAIDKELLFLTRGVSQILVQSETLTQRPIYVRLPKTLMPLLRKLLVFDLPLHGVPKAGLQRHRACRDYQRHMLSLLASVYDVWLLTKVMPYLQIISRNYSIHWFPCFQTDNTGNVGNYQFIKCESKMTFWFDCQPTVLLWD